MGQRNPRHGRPTTTTTSKSKVGPIASAAPFATDVHRQDRRRRLHHERDQLPRSPHDETLQARHRQPEGAKVAGQVHVHDADRADGLQRARIPDQIRLPSVDDDDRPPNEFTTEATSEHEPESKRTSRRSNQPKFILPAGMTLNPSAANGLEACKPSQAHEIEGTEKFTEAFGVACPAGSKIGTCHAQRADAAGRLADRRRLPRPARGGTDHGAAVHDVRGRELGEVRRLGAPGRARESRPGDRAGDDDVQQPARTAVHEPRDQLRTGTSSRRSPTRCSAAKRKAWRCSNRPRRRGAENRRRSVRRSRAATRARRRSNRRRKRLTATATAARARTSRSTSRATTANSTSRPSRRNCLRAWSARSRSPNGARKRPRTAKRRRARPTARSARPRCSRAPAASRSRSPARCT